MNSNEPKLCLKCLNFPCTCGAQYHDLTKKNLLGLIKELLDLAKTKYDVKFDASTIGGVRLLDYINGITEAKPSLLGLNLVLSMPRLWQNTINKTPTPSECLSKLANYTTESYTLPSVLAMILVKLVYTDLITCDLLAKYIDGLSDNYTIFKKSSQHAIKYMTSAFIEAGIAELHQNMIISQRRLTSITNHDTDMYHELNKNFVLTRELMHLAEAINKHDLLRFSSSLAGLLVGLVEPTAVPEQTASNWLFPISAETDALVYYEDQRLMSIITEYIKQHPIDDQIPLI